MIADQRIIEYIDSLESSQGSLLDSIEIEARETRVPIIRRETGALLRTLIAALSPSRQLTLLGELHRLTAEEASQFVIATHSPILMAFPGARIYVLEEEGIRTAAYRETEHYQLTRRFLEDPERMLRYLLEV